MPASKTEAKLNHKTLSYFNDSNIIEGDLRFLHLGVHVGSRL